MPIGDYYSLFSRNIVAKTSIRILGTLDLHTQIRLSPVIKFLSKYLDRMNFKDINILEIGCGSGVNAFEIYKIVLKKGIKLNYVGCDLSEHSINNAKIIVEKLQGDTSMSFSNEDAFEFLNRWQGLSFDVILLIDVIEHVNNPDRLILLCEKYLKNAGIFVVSVPTPLYPKFFGVNFSTKIGHLVDGYSLQELDKLFGKYKRIKYIYNTGLISNIGCYLYYNKLNFNNKYFDFVKSLILYPFKFLDLINGPKISCSLFAVYKKNEE